MVEGGWDGGAQNRSQTREGAAEEGQRARGRARRKLWIIQTFIMVKELDY